MNEAADIANSIPVIVALSMWWAFLSTLDILFGPQQTGTTKRPKTDERSGTANLVADDPRVSELREVDSEFSAEAFLAGAQRVYESVLGAYAAGDLTALQRFLSAEVLEAFASACADRAAREQTLELTFIGIESAEIADTATTSEAMEISVRFRAQIVSAERAATGELVSGDPATVMVARDLWTFSRPVRSTSATWRIVATDEG